MPDGDEVRKKLGREFQRSYKRLCQGALSEAELASDAVRSTKKKIESYGDEAFQLLREIALEIEQVQAHLPLFHNQVDWHALTTSIARKAQETRMDKRAKHLVLRATDEQITTLRQGGRSHNHHIDLLYGYLWQTYRADFEAYVASAPDHMHHASPATIRVRLEQIKPFVLEQLSAYAERAYHTEYSRV